MATETERHDDELDTWLAALRGDGGDGEDAELGKTLRRVVRAEQAAAEESVDEQQLAHGKERLMFRLAQEDTKRRRVQWPQSPMALAASVAIVAMIAVFTFTNTSIGPGQDPNILMAYGEIDQVRGVAPKPSVLVEENPGAAALDLAERLKDLRVPFELRMDPDDDAARLLSIQIDGVENRDALLELLREAGVEFPDLPVIAVRLVKADSGSR